ncbi:MAG: type I-C CRISPR-associated protein Cas5 [Deltaproteobacteria bacterium]|nr:type I-C CRISPR-associated protein Cas5 [Deltaproteobacteria bacterium]
MSEKNSIEFKVHGRYALFTDPITRIGGEKSSYQIPTYEALKGIAKSIYWKPTVVWIVDEVRIMQRIRTQTKGMKPLKYSSGGNDLSIYTYLVQVEYQVRVHFEWNRHHPELEQDCNDGKHYAIAKRMLERGGRQDIFLGTRDCQGYVEPCEFGSGGSPYDSEGEVAFGLMFHGFDYPDETGEPELQARFWRPVMRDGCIRFIRPEQCDIRKFIRPMGAKRFGSNQITSVEIEFETIGG